MPATSEYTLIKLMRGTKAKILANPPNFGEPGFANDTGELYIANSVGDWVRIGGGDGDLTETADKYSDLLRISKFAYTTFDPFSDTTYIAAGTTTMVHVVDLTKYTWDYSSGERILDSVDLLDPLSGVTTVNNCFIHINFKTTLGDDPVLYARTDTGNAWEQIINNSVHEFTNPGAGIYLRAAADTASHNTGEIYDWGVCYKDAENFLISPVEIPRNWKNVTSPGTTTVYQEDSGTVITTEGATGAETFTLDGSLRKGSHLEFIKLTANNIIIQADTGETIGTSSVAGTLQNTTGAETSAGITITKATDTHWAITGSNGTWATT